MRSDYSSHLLAAGASGATVICGAGPEASDTIKQAHEFGLIGKGPILAAPFLGDSTVRAVGLEEAQDWCTPFCWDRDGGAWAFSDRLEAQVPDRRPNEGCAAACSGALHSLKWVAALGVDSGRNGRAVAAAMKATLIEDTLFAPSTLRADGRVMRDMLLLQVKHPSASTKSWGTCAIVSTLPANGLYAALGTSGCKLVHA